MIGPSFDELRPREPGKEIAVFYFIYRCPKDTDGSCKPVVRQQQKMKIVRQIQAEELPEGEMDEMELAEDNAINSAPICPNHNLSMIPETHELKPVKTLKF